VKFTKHRLMRRGKVCRGYSPPVPSRLPEQRMLMWGGGIAHSLSVEREWRAGKQKLVQAHYSLCCIEGSGNFIPPP